MNQPLVGSIKGYNERDGVKSAEGPYLLLIQSHPARRACCSSTLHLGWGREEKGLPSVTTHGKG